MDWLTLDTLPELNQRVVVAAWEFGCAPEYFIVRYWHSTAPGQPPKFYLDTTYCTSVPIDVGSVVKFWMPLPELPPQVSTSEISIVNERIL